MPEVRLNTAQFRQELLGPNGEVARILLAKARRVQAEAVRLCPVDNGDLRGSINISPVYREGGELAVNVGTDLEYGLYVHEGTGIYGPRGDVIRPVRAKALRWEAKRNVGRPGRPRFQRNVVYAKYVRGVKPRPFLRDALRVLH